MNKYDRSRNRRHRHKEKQRPRLRASRSMNKRNRKVNELSDLMNYWRMNGMVKESKLCKISNPIACIQIISPYLWTSDRVLHHFEVINSMKSAFSKLIEQCMNAQQKKHVDTTLNTLYKMEQKLVELKKDCKSIRQKGQSLLQCQSKQSDGILKWIKFATNYHQKQSEWERAKNEFIASKMQF